jgi:hypothetical protein
MAAGWRVRPGTQVNVAGTVYPAGALVDVDLSAELAAYWQQAGWIEPVEAPDPETQIGHAMTDPAETGGPS